MQEKQVTVEGTTYALQPPFHVLATANPIEHEGTYPLPEAQLDRFLLRVSFGYPTPDEEWDVLRRRIARRQEEAVLEPGGRRRRRCSRCRPRWRTSSVEDSVGRYIVELTAATREHPQVLVGASPRGSLALLLLARAVAAMAGRDYVVPEDVKAVAVAGAGPPDHAAPGDVAAPGRLRRSVVASVLDQVPAPASGALPRHAGRPARAGAPGA